MLLCYITDRTQFPGDEASRRRQLLEKITEAAHSGVDYIQLREKDLSSRELEDLARAARLRAEAAGRGTVVLIHSRTDVALAVNAGGVHLRGDDIAPSEVRAIWAHCGVSNPVISLACHSPAEVAAARAQGTDFAVFAPVFEKVAIANPRGLEDLRTACQHQIPVLALGGVTLNRAAGCMKAGAAGIAGIRLFQQNEIAAVVHSLRRCRVA